MRRVPRIFALLLCALALAACATSSDQSGDEEALTQLTASTWANVADGVNVQLRQGTTKCGSEDVLFLRFEIGAEVSLYVRDQTASFARERLGSEPLRRAKLPPGAVEVADSGNGFSLQMLPGDSDRLYVVTPFEDTLVDHGEQAADGGAITLVEAWPRLIEPPACALVAETENAVNASLDRLTELSG